MLMLSNIHDLGRAELIQMVVEQDWTSLRTITRTRSVHMALKEVMLKPMPK